MGNAEILVVEDDSVFATLLQQQLNNMGYRVAATVASGEAAIQKTLELRPDLVLIDIELAGELGIQAAGQIQAQLDVPVVYLTNSSDDAASPFGYILKPPQERELQITIEMALHNHTLEKKLKELACFPAENPFPVLRVAGDGNLLYANRASAPLLAMWGIQANQPVPSDCQNLVEQALASGQNQESEIECEQRTFSLTFAPVVEANYVNVYGLDITQRKQAEEELRVKDSAIASSINAIAFADLNGNLTYVNQSFLDLWRYQSEQQVLGKPAVEFWREPHKATEVIRTLQNEGGWFGELVAQKRDGSLMTVQLSTNLITNADNQPVAMMASFVDVTERKQTENALKLDEERLEALLKLSQLQEYSEKELIDYSLEEIVRLTKSEIGYFHFINPDQHSLQLYTWSKAALENCTAVKTPHYPLDQAGVWADCVRLRAPVVHNDYQALPNKQGYPEGHSHIVRHMSAPIFDGDQIIAIAGVGNKDTPYNQSDIRQLSLFTNSLWSILKQRRAEQAQRLQSTALESAANAIVITDRDGAIIWINPAFTQMTGYSLEKVVGKTPRILKAGKQPASFYTELWQTILAGKVWHNELVNRRKDGSLYTEEQTITPLCGEDGNVTHFIGVKQDITARKQAEERQAQLLKDIESANRELRDFAYVVSHDLKAPLRAISSLAEWLSTDYADKFDQKGQEMIHLLLARVKRMHNLIEGVLQYSRVGRIREEHASVNLNKLVAEVIDSLAPSPNMVVTVECELPTVICEKTRIAQVFQNLLSNAIKYIDKPAGQIAIACASQGDYWKFSVADNGPGIEEKYFARIFQIFQTLHPRDEFESTGVGLAVVKKAVELHNGQVWVESTVGKGSTFFFTLPK